METLKKISVFILLITSLGFIAQAQEDKVLKAFSESYTFEKTGNYANAAEALKKVYEENSYAINLRLGWLNYMAGQYTVSMTYYSTCMKLMPLSIEARLGFTYPASAAGNWDQVLAKYEEILKIDPNNYTANLYAGQIYFRRKDYKKAANYFDLLLNHYPFTYDVLISTAWNNYYLAKTREAKVLFQKANYLNPGDQSAADGLKLLN
jgi:tetratricopeptide (TPR) repeat protein